MEKLITISEIRGKRIIKDINLLQLLREKELQINEFPPLLQEEIFNSSPDLIVDPSNVVGLRELKKYGDEMAILENVFEKCRKNHPDLFEDTGGKRKNLFPCKTGIKWEDIKIILTADDKVRIETSEGVGHFSYHDLGMSDKRSADTPTLLWALFKLFSKNNGEISRQNVHYNPKLPNTAKRLNKHLKELFGITDSIYTAHYKKHKAYITKIKFSDQTIGDGQPVNMLGSGQSTSPETDGSQLFNEEINDKEHTVNLSKKKSL